MRTIDRVLELIKANPNITRFEISTKLSLVETGEAIRILEKRELIERNEETWS